MRRWVLLTTLSILVDVCIADVCWKEGYDRSGSWQETRCKQGWYKSGLLCYPNCQPGYSGVGPLCVKDCTGIVIFYYLYLSNILLSRERLIFVVKKCDYFQEWIACPTYGNGWGEEPQCPEDGFYERKGKDCLKYCAPGYAVEEACTTCNFELSYTEWLRKKSSVRKIF